MHDGVKSVDQQLDCRGGCPAFLASIIDARRQARKITGRDGRPCTLQLPQSSLQIFSCKLIVVASVQATVHQHEDEIGSGSSCSYEQPDTIGLTPLGFEKPLQGLPLTLRKVGRLPHEHRARDWAVRVISYQSQVGND